MRNIILYSKVLNSFIRTYHPNHNRGIPLNHPDIMEAINKQMTSILYKKEVKLMINNIDLAIRNLLSQRDISMYLGHPTFPTQIINGEKYNFYRTVRLDKQLSHFVYIRDFATAHSIYEAPFFVIPMLDFNTVPNNTSKPFLGL